MLWLKTSHCNPSFPSPSKPTEFLSGVTGSQLLLGTPWTGHYPNAESQLLQKYKKNALKKSINFTNPFKKRLSQLCVILSGPSFSKVSSLLHELTEQSHSWAVERGKSIIDHKITDNAETQVNSERTGNKNIRAPRERHSPSAAW